jgi:hypothetical protein
MKKPTLLILSVVLLFIVMACTIGEVAATSTPQPTNTQEPSPTETVAPPTLTPTHKPTKRPTKTDIPKVTLSQFERALRDARYTSVQFSDGSGAVWTLDNVFENTYTSDDGQIQMDVLNSIKSRLSHMEEKFTVMDGLFAQDFMAQLRDANEEYAATVGAGVTGKASNSYGPDPSDFWQYQSANYNVSDQTIGAYDVRFALFFQQWTCPSDYICTFPSFGNQQFTGQASFVFYEVVIWLAT